MFRKAIFIRVDSSKVIGSGHLMRCINLANMLRNAGAVIEFITQNLPGNSDEKITENNFRYHVLGSIKNDNHHEVCDEHIKWFGVAQKQDMLDTVEVVKGSKVDWIIVDHYALDYKWEIGLKNYTEKIMVIDDLVNRRHYCDLLLDQNLHNNANSEYRDLLLSNKTKIFLGPSYSLLSSSFNDSNLLRKRTGRLNHLLIYLGGGDKAHIFLKTVVESLSLLVESKFSITIIAGDSYDEVQLDVKYLEIKDIDVLKFTNDMPKMICLSDLAIGACGISQWERCVLGLPSIVAVTADNQIKDAEALDKLGAVINLGNSEYISPADVADAINKLCSDNLLLKKISNNALSVIVNRKHSLNELEKEIMTNDP